MQLAEEAIKNQNYKRALPGLYLLWIIVAVFVLLSTVSDSFFDVLLCLALFLVIPMWGHIIMLPIYYKYGLLLEGFVWGSVSGLALSPLITAVVVYNWGWNITLIFMVIFVIPCVLFITLYVKQLHGNAFTHGPGIASDIVLPIGLIIVTIFFYYPFKNLGVLVGDKYLYAWLFGHDFINRMVHVDSLSRGVPLQGFFFAGEKLSHYWLAYVYPAFIHNISAIKLNIKQILQITQIFYSILTVAALIFFLKSIIGAKKNLMLVTLLALCCYSYVGLYNVGLKSYVWITEQASVELFGYNLDNLSGFSHSIYRFFLVEPQGTLAIAVILLILSLYRQEGSLYKFGTMGLLLGLLFGIEASNGIMLFAWFLITGVLAVYKKSNARFTIGINHLFAVLFAAFIYGVFFSIQMYDFQTGSKALQLATNKIAILSGPFYFLITYGPLFIFGIMGSVVYFKNDEKKNDCIGSYCILLLVGLVFTFFIQNPTEPHFGLFKATRILPLGLLVLSAFYLDNMKKFKYSISFAIGVMLLAIPTLITDNYIASNISKPSTYVRKSDMEAAEWIKNNLPCNAIIQAEPNHPESDDIKAPKYSYSLIPIFAERRTSIGEWKVSSQEHGKSDEVNNRFHEVRQMFATGDEREALTMIKRYKIEYLYVGELENKLYGKAVDKFKNNKYYERVYSTYKTDIYRIMMDNIQERTNDICDNTRL